MSQGPDLVKAQIGCFVNGRRGCEVGITNWASGPQGRCRRQLGAQGEGEREGKAETGRIGGAYDTSGSPFGSGSALKVSKVSRPLNR